MRKLTLSWNIIVGVIKEDAHEKDCVVDFLDQKDSVDDTVYVYFKDDDQSAIYALNDQHRAQMVDTLNNCHANEVADTFWSELNEHYRMT